MVPPGNADVKAAKIAGRAPLRARSRASGMKTQRILVALTVINLVLLVTALAGSRSSSAESVAPVLRGRAFEIVDDRGHVRASITVLPADPGFKMPDGTTGSPETV